MHILKSRIVLGTVQFGLPYGVSNRVGKTLSSDVADILDYASKKGINYLDTASSYGESESIIGDLANSNDWKIITKIPSISNENNNCKSIVNKSFFESLRKLRRNCIDSLLIHSCDDLFTKHGKELFETMLELKDDKKIKKIGVSVYNKDQINRLLELYDVDIVQLPISIMDQRLLKSGHLNELKSCGIEIHARSIFLQGLLLMDYTKVPPFFLPISEKLKQFNKIAKQLSIKPLDLALSFVLNIKELDHILIGVNNLKQLKEIVEVSIVDTSIEDYHDIAFSEEQFVNPSRWPF